MSNMTQNENITCKVIHAKQDIEKAAAALRSLNDELFELLPDNMIVQVAKPFYQITVDYVNKLRRELVDIKNDVEKLSDTEGQ